MIGYQSPNDGPKNTNGGNVQNNGPKMAPPPPPPPAGVPQGNPGYPGQAPNYTPASAPGSGTSHGPSQQHYQATTQGPSQQHYQATTQGPSQQQYQASSQVPVHQQYHEPSPGQMSVGQDPLTKPMSVGGYIGTMLLMAIPLVGFILMLVWSFGSNVNINKKNFCRATLIMAVIGIVVSILLSSVLGAIISSLFYNGYGGRMF